MYWQKRNAFEMHLTDEKDLAGLPESVKEAAKEVANLKIKKVMFLP